MFTKRFLLSVALLGLGLVFPTAAQSITPVTANETGHTRTQTNFDFNVSALNIESKIEPEANGQIDSEITFNGNANEVVLLRIEREDGLPLFINVVDLYAPTGEKVFSRRNYPDFMTFEYQYPGYRTFLLPETGEYRFVFGDDASAVNSIDPSVANIPYSVEVRDATYYERLLMSAEDFIDAEAYETAFSRLALAVEDSPEIPAAYVQRLFAYAEMLYESTEFEARLDELSESETESSAEFENGIFPLIYETFLTLSAEEQAVVIGDLRQLNTLYTDAIANNELSPDQGEFEEIPFDGIVEFLETGMPTDAMRMLFFGTSVQTQEPM